MKIIFYKKIKTNKNTNIHVCIHTYIYPLAPVHTLLVNPPFQNTLFYLLNHFPSRSLFLVQSPVIVTAIFQGSYWTSLLFLQTDNLHLNSLNSLNHIVSQQLCGMHITPCIIPTSWTSKVVPELLLLKQPFQLHKGAGPEQQLQLSLQL